MWEGLYQAGRILEVKACSFFRMLGHWGSWWACPIPTRYKTEFDARWNWERKRKNMLCLKHQKILFEWWLLNYSCTHLLKLIANEGQKKYKACIQICYTYSTVSDMLIKQNHCSFSFLDILTSGLLFSLFPPTNYVRSSDYFVLLSAVIVSHGRQSRSLRFFLGGVIPKTAQ